MSPRSLVLCVSALVLLACGCTKQTDQNSPKLPAVLEKQAAQLEITPWSGSFAIDGVTLWRTTPKTIPADGDSTASIVGVTGDGALLQGAALFARVADAPPDELARRAFAILLGQQGAESVPPDTTSSFVSDQERALIKPPALDGGVLTFWGFRGSMNPELIRYRLTVSTAAVTQTPASALVTPR